MMICAVQRVENDQFPSHWEYHVGDFAVRRSPNVTDVVFSPNEAHEIAEISLTLACDRVENVYLLFYPWLDRAWEQVRARDWVTTRTREFVRHGVFGRRKTARWVTGFARTRAKLVETINWVWTLPAHDTFIILPVVSSDPNAALDIFEDDREDDGSNERRMLSLYPNILSRGERSEYLRFLSTSFDEADADRIIATASARAHANDEHGR